MSFGIVSFCPQATHGGGLASSPSLEETYISPSACESRQWEMLASWDGMVFIKAKLN